MKPRLSRFFRVHTHSLPANWILPLVLALSACRGASRSEVEKLHLGLVSLGQVDSSVLASLVPKLLSESGGGLGGGCREALKALSPTAPPAERVGVLEKAMAECQVRCPGDRSGWSALNRIEQAAAVVEACDKVGPDPIFGGVLAPLRAEMEPLHYAVIRHVLGQQRERLLENGSPRALVTWERFERLLPVLAYELIYEQRRLLLRSPTLPVGEEMSPQPPQTLRPGAPPIVSVVAPDRTFFNGEAVGEAQLGQRSAAALAEFRRRFGEPPGVILQAASDVPFGTVRALLPRLQPLGMVDFALPIRDRRYLWGMRWSRNPRAPMVLRIGHEPRDWSRLLDEELSEALALRAEAVEVHWAGTVPTAVTAWARPGESIVRRGPEGELVTVKGEAQLKEALKGITLTELVVVADDAAKWVDVLRTMYLFAAEAPPPKVRLAASAEHPLPVADTAVPTPEAKLHAPRRSAKPRAGGRP